MKKLLLLFLSVSTFTSVSQESILLRTKYKKGDTYKLEAKITQDMGSVMSQTIEVSMSQKISSVSDNQYTSSLKIEKIKLDMLQGGQAISYDSSLLEEELDDVGKMMNNQMGPFLKVDIVSVANNLGEVLETKVTPDIPGAKDMTKQSSSVIYPKEAVKVGSVFSMKKSENGMDFNFNYKVASITKKEITLTISGDVSGMATGNVTGSILIDKNTCIPFKSKLDMNMSIGEQKLITTVATDIKKIN